MRICVLCQLQETCTLYKEETLTKCKDFNLSHKKLELHDKRVIENFVKTRVKMKKKFKVKSKKKKRKVKPNLSRV